jgi:hypothetical protein
MRKVCILACTMFLIAAAGFSQTPSVAPLTNEALAAILGPAAVHGSCTLPQNEALFAANRPRTGLAKTCSATATCGADPSVSCSYGGSGGTCSFANRNCPNEQGHVTCNGVTTWCPTTCPPSVWCQQCDATGDCFACCRCDGGGAGHCAFVCG